MILLMNSKGWFRAYRKIFRQDKYILDNNAFDALNNNQADSNFKAKIGRSRKFKPARELFEKV